MFSDTKEYKDTVATQNFCSQFGMNLDITKPQRKAVEVQTNGSEVGERMQRAK